MAKRILPGLAAIIVVLALAYTGASWFIGLRTEMLIHDQVDVYNQQLDYYLPAGLQATLSLDEYQRHVFTADARYALTIGEGDEARRIRIAGHLVHGPFPYTAIIRGNIQPLLVTSYLRLIRTNDTQALFAARVDTQQPPITVRTTLTFQGSGRSVWQFQPLASEQRTATFSGGTATVTLSNHFQDATLNAEFGDFSIDEDSVTLHVQGIGVSGETSVADSGAASAAVAIRIAALESQTPLGPKQKTIDTRLAFSGTLAQGLVDGKLEYGVGHMQAGTLDLGGFELAAHVSDVDAQAVRAWQKIAAAGADGGGSPLQQPTLQAVISRLLAPQPVIAVDKLRWQMPAGTSSASLSLHFTQPDQAMALPLSLRLAEAVQRGEMNMSLSKPMLTVVLQHSFANAGLGGEQNGRRAKQMVAKIAASLQRSGLFVVKDDVLNTAITYQDRAFVVNGDKMSLSEFIGHLFALVMAFG